MPRPVLNARVLIVDDDVDFSAGLKRHLERHFATVDHARTESAATAMLEQNRYDLVILDIMLNYDTGGMRLCRSLRADDRWRGVPIMVLSSADVRYGLSIKSYLADERCLPADDFVDKGVVPEDIVERARRLVERPGADMRDDAR